MKLTTIIASAILIAFGLFATVYALSGFSLLLFFCGGNPFAYRALLSLVGVAAAWLLFWLIAFRPLRFLS